MTTLSVEKPYQSLFDLNGYPLSSGYVYIGTAGSNPETSLINTYWDSALTIPATNPVRTIAGYLSRNGSPGRLYVNAKDFSITVRDKNGELIFTDLYASPIFSSSVIPASIVYVDTLAELKAVTNLYGEISCLGRTSNGDGYEGDFVWVTGDQSANVSADTQSGIWVAPNSDPTGSSGAFKRISCDVHIKYFGASPSKSSAENTIAIQAAVDYASYIGSEVIGDEGTYDISYVRIKPGLKSFDFSKSVLKGNGTAPYGIVEFDGPTNRASAVVNDLFFRANIDCSNGDRTAVYIDGATNCTFYESNIYGFTNHATLNHYGLLFWAGSKRNIITKNNIIGYATPTQRGLLIDFIGEVADYGGYFSGSGVISSPTNACLDNIVMDNVLSYGSYAVNLLGSVNNIIANNVCRGQNHRSIYVAASSQYNIIKGNELLSYLSSGVVLGYGSVHNLVEDNVFLSAGTYAAGEAAVNINTGSKYNKVRNNKIYSTTNYGVYMACDSIGNEVDGNDIRGYYLAGVGLENDWVSPLPTNAFYSRPNYVAPGSGAYWSFNNSVDNVISNNVIWEAYTGRNVTAIYLAQINSSAGTELHDNIVDGNKVMTPNNLAYNLFIYSNLDSKNTGHRITNNLFDAGNSVASYNTAGATTWNDKIAYFSNNEQLDESLLGEAIAFTSADTTPDVSNNSGGIQRDYEFANSGATSVTNFDGGYSGQVIRIRMDANTTIVYGAGTIVTKGAVNITGRTSSDFVTFKNISSIWYEVSRSW